MFRLKKQQLFFSVAAILATAGVVFFVSYSLSQTANRAVLDISLSSDNYESSTKTFFDRSGLGNNGISVNNALFSNGKYGSVDGAMSFNGVSDRIIVQNEPSLNSFGTKMSISGWVKINSTFTGEKIIVRKDSSYQLGFYSSNIIRNLVATNGVSGWTGANDIVYNFEIGEWYNIVFTYNGNYMVTYVNGVQVGAAVVTGDVLSNTSSIGIGAQSGGSRFLHGDIEKIQIFNYALSDEEVENLYDSGRLVASGSSLNKGLVGYWSMDASDYNNINSRVTDKSSFENHGVNYGASFAIDRFGKEGGAMRFDGSGTNDGVIFGNHIVVPENITDTRNCPDGCTYSLWLNVDADAVDRMSLLRGSGTIRHIEIYSSSKRFRTEAGLQNGYSFGTGNFPDNVRGDWAHFVIVFANNESGRPVRWYQNGELFHTGYMTNGTYPDTEYFSFGSIGRSTGTTSYNYAPSFDGAIDDVRIYNRALSEEEVKVLYNSYNPKITTGTLQKGLVLDMPLKLKYTKSETPGSEIMTDRTPYSNDGQNYGAIITSDGASFDGSSSGITIEDFPLIFNDSISLSVWAYYNDDSRGIIFGNYNSFNDVNFEKYTSRRLRLYWNRGERDTFSSVNAFELNQWNHLVLIRNKQLNRMEFWVNGELVSTVLNAGSDIVSTSQNFRIGKDSRTGITVTDGSMSNLQIYNRALSEKEIKTLYDRGRSDSGIIFTPEN